MEGSKASSGAAFPVMGTVRTYVPSLFYWAEQRADHLHQQNLVPWAWDSTGLAE